MEDLKKQSGEKQRKMETKIDNQAHKAPVKEEKISETKKEEKIEERVTEEKKTEVKKPVVKKEMAFVRMSGLGISTKQTREICRFLMGKTPEKAIEEMTKVTKMKMAVPMRGEIPHRKGKMMSGRYPINTSKVMVNVLKSLAGNASVNGLNNPVITLASASWGSRPQRRGGRKFKRTNLYMEVREAKEKMKEKHNDKEKIAEEKK